MTALAWNIGGPISEQFGFELGRLHVGYAFHDFGPALFASQITSSFSESWQGEGVTYGQDYRSTGVPITVGAVLAEAHATAAPLTLTLTGGAGPGTVLCLAIAAAITDPLFVPLPDADLVVTDSQGAGVLDFSGLATLTLGAFMDRGASGWNARMPWFFANYTLSAPLSAGDTITIDFPNWTTVYVTARIHPMANVQIPNPLGQDPPGTNLTFTFGPFVYPRTSNFVPALGWIGTTLIAGHVYPRQQSVVVPGSLVSFDLNIARGVAVHRPNGALTAGDHLIQMPTGDIVLVPGCTVEIDTMAADGLPRSADSFSDIQLAITDVGALEQIE